MLQALAFCRRNIGSIWWSLPWPAFHGLCQGSCYGDPASLGTDRPVLSYGSPRYRYTFAYAAGELLRDRPIFDAILEDDLKVRFPKTAKKDQLQRNPYVYEAAVESGSLAEGKSLKELKFPGKALVVSVRRGDSTLIPDASLVLMPGDYLYILPNEARISDLTGLLKTQEKE